MQDALPVRKEFAIRAPSAPQLELRLHWFGRALEARRGYIVRLERRRHRGEHVASISYEMPLPRAELARSRAELAKRHELGGSRDAMTQPRSMHHSASVNDSDHDS